MKRDMDIIRALMLSVETNDKSLVTPYSAEQLAYHVELLRDAEMVEAAVSYRSELGTKIPHFYQISRLTWKGHEHLDAMRDESVWNKAKETILKKGGSWTFDLLKEALAQIIANQVGLPPR